VGRGVWTAVVAAGLACSAAAAAPDDLGALLRGLGAGETEVVTRALRAIGERGDVAALPALDAFLDDRLRVGADGAVYLYDGARRVLLHATTGAIVSPEPAGLRTAEVDNEIRRLALPVIARLRLSAPDPATRLQAAEELAQSAGDEALPLMRAALDRERDRRVRDALALALARHDLQSDSVDKRVAAIDVLRGLAKASTKGEIDALERSDKEPRVRQAAAAALSAIRRSELLISAAGNLFYGLSLASVFLFAALGLAITFGVMGVINMAHGEMLTVGAYATYVVQGFFQRRFPSLFALYPLVAIPVAFAAAALVGIVLERLVIRRLYGRPLETLLATWGVSLAMIQTIRQVFGAANVAVANPGWLAGGPEVLPGVVVPYARIAVVLFVVAAAAFVWFLLQRTRLGLQVRAVTQNRAMAACMGVSTARIDMWTFGLGSGIAGLGGVALSQLGNVGPELGQSYILDSFMVVVLGGVGRIAGTVGAALGLGIVQKFLEPFSGAVLGKIAVLVFIILFIQRRPQGMFPVKGRVEA
jgi:urea transport system permease protein